MPPPPSGSHPAPYISSLSLKMPPAQDLIHSFAVYPLTPLSLSLFLSLSRSDFSFFSCFLAPSSYLPLTPSHFHPLSSPSFHHSHNHFLFLFLYPPSTGEPDPIPPGSLLVGDVDGKCEEKYNTWTNKSKSRTVRTCVSTCVHTDIFIVSAIIDKDDTLQWELWCHMNDNDYKQQTHNNTC